MTKLGQTASAANCYKHPPYSCSFQIMNVYTSSDAATKTSRDPKAKKIVLTLKYAHTLASWRSVAPPPLKTLLDYNDPTTSRFKDQIIVYNGMFCFTSFGANIDHSINTGRGPYTFRINGQSYHRIGSLLSADGVQPRYAQLYFFDTENEIRNRMSAFVDNEKYTTMDETIVARLIQMLDQSSAIVKTFRMAKEWCHSHNSVNFGPRLLSERTSTRQYNAPTVSEVAALIINDFGDGIPLRDIIIKKNNAGLQRIFELHPSYMALQYLCYFRMGRMDSMKR
nr:helicase [Tanacetum cinerariifolium]